MSDSNNTPKQGQLNIEIDESVAQGVYSNLAIINHSPSEFVLDFISVMPGTSKSKVRSIIILTPQHAKRLNKAIAENISRYEENHGVISDKDQPHIPLSFGPTGQA